MITIQIKTDNAAFEDDRRGETARILRELADSFDQFLPKARLRDVNGNQVGTVRLTGKDR